jgi:hypothetical protein
MKILLFAAALLACGAALAQTDPMPATGGVSAPSNAAPKLDARGIPVVSDPAEVPAGFNPPPGTNAGVPSTANTTPQPSTENYPACSRTVTDNCVQTYERGVRRPRR